MSKRESENMDTTGYLLPEDSQFRLKKLHEHMVFLSHLAQPRTYDEKQEWAPEIRTGELAVCLELLAEQAGLVLQQVSWPAERKADREPSYAAPDTREMEGEAMEDEAGNPRFLFGVTLDQMDELDRLLDMIRAHGDVVFSAHDADLAIGTLPLVGHAIFDDAIAAKDIIGQVTSQRLGGSPKPRSVIREERAIYGARTAGRTRHGPAGLMALRLFEMLPTMQLTVDRTQQALQVSSPYRPVYATLFYTHNLCFEHNSA